MSDQPRKDGRRKTALRRFHDALEELKRTARPGMFTELTIATSDGQIKGIQISTPEGLHKPAIVLTQRGLYVRRSTPKWALLDINRVHHVPLIMEYVSVLEEAAATGAAV